MGDANGKKIPARAREMILTCAARVILSGHDGVTAREVADVMRRTTCERTKRALVGEDGTNHAREESAFETLRDASAAEADARAAEANVAVEDEDDDELAERKAVSELVGWCVSKGAQGSGLSVLLPDGRGRGRGLEASRDIEVRGPVGL